MGSRSPHAKSQILGKYMSDNTFGGANVPTWEGTLATPGEYD